MKRREFFKKLAQNNTREWFAQHKPEYEAIRTEWVEGMDRVQALLSAEWPEIATVRPKTFRIYRDTRFSNDKTPYKTHIGSALGSSARGDVHNCGLYIEDGIPSSDSGVFGGVWCPESAQLRKLRKAIVDNIEEFEEIINAPALVREYPEWYGERLKTAPQGWPKDHPQIELLRLKSYGRFSLMTQAELESKRWPELVAERAAILVPLIRFLDYSLNEE